MLAVRRLVLVALVSVAGFGSSFPASASAAGFTCPDTFATAIPGAAPLLPDLYSGADDITAGNRLGELLADLRKSGMKPALVDRLIGAYCPLVASDNILSGPDEVDVLVQTALTPSLLRPIDQAAARAGISRNEWIERAIKQQLTAL